MKIGCQAPTCYHTGATRLHVTLIRKAYHAHLVIDLHWAFEVYQGDVILVCTRCVRGMNVYCFSSSVLLGALVSRKIKLSSTYDPLQRLLEPTKAKSTIRSIICDGTFSTKYMSPRQKPTENSLKVFYFVSMLTGKINLENDSFLACILVTKGGTTKNGLT